MPPKKNAKAKTKKGNGATLDFESQLLAAADKLRMHVSEGKNRETLSSQFQTPWE